MRRPFDDRQVAVLQALVHQCRGHRLVLIGAGAIGCSLEMTWRSTQDLDPLLASNAEAVVDQLPDLGLRQDPKLEHRWIAQNGVALDILPASEREISQGKLTWPTSGNEMSLVGMDLALQHTFRVPLGDKLALDVASVPALAVLKMAAWLDSGSARTRDLSDLGYLMADYLAADAMRRWDDAQLTSAEFDEQSALALGLDVGSIAEKPHAKLVRRFVDSVRDTEGAAFHHLSGANILDDGQRRELGQRRLIAFERGTGEAAQVARRRNATRRGKGRDRAR